MVKVDMWYNDDPTMYSWKITKNVPTKIVDFIAMLQEEKYSKALVYGNDIINILNEEV